MHGPDLLHCHDLEFGISAMRRRDLISLFGGAAAARPLAARAQPMPVIGFISAYPHDSFAQYSGGVSPGLKEIGYFEGVSDFAAVCPRQLAVQFESAVRQPFGTA
jgi:hypothetical protein